MSETSEPELARSTCRGALASRESIRRYGTRFDSFEFRKPVKALLVFFRRKSAHAAGPGTSEHRVRSRAQSRAMRRRFWSSPGTSRRAGSSCARCSSWVSSRRMCVWRDRHRTRPVVRGRCRAEAAGGYSQQCAQDPFPDGLGEAREGGRALAGSPRDRRRSSGDANESGGDAPEARAELGGRGSSDSRRAGGARASAGRPGGDPQYAETRAGPPFRLLEVPRVTFLPLHSIRETPIGTWRRGSDPPGGAPG